MPPPVRALEHPSLEIDREAPPRHQLEPSRAHRERDLELDRLALAGGDLERNDEPVSRGTDRRGRDSSALAALLSRRRAIDPARRNGDAREMLPALRAALICEKLLTEADGVMSAIRIFSRLDLAPGATSEATLLLMLANVEPVALRHRRSGADPVANPVSPAAAAHGVTWTSTVAEEMPATVSTSL